MTKKRKKESKLQRKVYMCHKLGLPTYEVQSSKTTLDILPDLKTAQRTLKACSSRAVIYKVFPNGNKILL